MTASNTSEVRVGAVTVTHNSADVLPEFLGSIASQTGVRLHTYVVDSGSSDETLAVVGARAGDRLTVIQNDSNVGFAAGSNQGIERAISDGVDFVLLINNDTVFEPDLVARLVSAARSNGLQLVSPLILATDPPDSIWYSGGTLSRTALVARHRYEGRDRSAAPKVLTPTPFGSGCCLLIEPDVFRRVGLLDPIYFVYFEDADFAVRVGEAGLTYWMDPRAVLTHKASSLTGGKRSDFTLRWTARNWPLMIRRNTRGVHRLLALGYVQLWALARLLLRRDGWSVYRLRQQRFVEALSVDTSVPVPRLAPVAVLHGDGDRTGR